MPESRFSPARYFDFNHTAHAALFPEDEPVWAVLARIQDYLLDRVRGQDLRRADVSPMAFIGPHVILEEGVIVEPFATVKGPAWIGPGSLIRSGAYLRENVIAGAGVTFGNSSEFKNCLLFDHVQAPHFNYVGDSILGHQAHLGAGVILSNVRLDRQHVMVSAGEERFPSGLRKFGAIVGDRTEIGCNAVLSPGSIVGRDCILYPGTQWRGYLPSHQIVKLNQHLTLIEQRPKPHP
jgi:UDP-N-acetylglucosamine diphosphorylase / glucose-1-phosphate thymidylyltransferase / UDP-N-acetylgalactosamine diphosphorylase / glucosamine-1-phosphate N-acetyltransferase / galactosamine-1-phosphate N-acetyltransferase